jgi:predicted NBD/HSP70 family sugar kinase
MADHRQDILDTIRDRGPVSLRDIEVTTGLGRTTVAMLVTDLRAQGAVVVAREAERSGRREGRPPLRFVLNPELALTVGILFEHTHIRAAVADLGLRLVATDVRFMPVAEDPRAALGVAASMVDGLVGMPGISRSRVIGVAIGVAAPVDEPSGTVRDTNALRGWVDLKPGPVLEKRLGLPVQVANDATLAGFGEAVAGAATGSRNVVYVKLSASIGCGIVIDGVPYTGASGTAGELAHLVVEDGGTLCFCGSRGCLQTVVGGHAVLSRLLSSHARVARQAESDREALKGSELTLDERLKVVIDCAVEGDLACRRVLQDVAEHVGQALVNVCNLLNPEIIVVGGVFSDAGALLLEPLDRFVRTYTKHLYKTPVRIVPPQLGEWAEVVGAAAHVVRSPSPAARRRLQRLLDGAGSEPNGKVAEAGR